MKRFHNWTIYIVQFLHKLSIGVATYTTCIEEWNGFTSIQQIRVLKKYIRVGNLSKNRVLPKLQLPTCFINCKTHPICCITWIFHKQNLKIPFENVLKPTRFFKLLNTMIPYINWQCYFSLGIQLALLINVKYKKSLWHHRGETPVLFYYEAVCSGRKIGVNLSYASGAKSVWRHIIRVRVNLEINVFECCEDCEEQSNSVRFN